MLKCTKFYFGPDPLMGAYSAPSSPIAEFKGPTSKRWEGREENGKEGDGKEGKGEGLMGKGGGGKGGGGRVVEFHGSTTYF